MIHKKILNLLDARQRKILFGLLGMMALMAVFDLIGVASILPFLAVLSDPGAVERSQAIARLAAFSGAETHTELVRFLGLCVLALFVAGVAVKATTFYLITRFSRSAIQSLAIELLRGYLAQPYEYFLTRNSNEIGKSILAEAAFVINQAVSPAIRLVANGLVAFFLFALLMVIEPIGALITLVVIGGLFGAIYLRMRKSLLELGDARVRTTEERFKIVSEAMSSIKTVKLMGLERVMVERFEDPSRRLASYQARIQLVATMPQFALEAICFGGMMVLVLWLLYTGTGDLAAMLPILGAFAFAGIKSMPVVQAIFKDAAMLRAGAPSLDEINKDLNRLPDGIQAVDAEPLPFSKDLCLDRVTYTYPGAEQPAVNRVSLCVPACSSAAFVGATGAGKSTVVDLILGLVPPTSGSVKVDGIPLQGDNRRQWQRGIGYVPQDIRLVDGTVRENIAFGVPADEIDDEIINRVIELACLERVIAGLPEGLEQRIGEGGSRLSGGERQRVGIARALYRNPQIIVFDEATSALDTITEREVIDAIERVAREKTVIVVAHRLSTVKRCDRIFVMDHGRVVASGDHDSLAANDDTFRRLLAAV
jgi:ABC-type multidrug transport system fused ATPase/permease subunit